MLRFDYSDGAEMLCGICGGQCFLHFADGERIDRGECCVPEDQLPALLIEAQRTELADLLDAAPDFYECSRCGGDVRQCDHETSDRILAARENAADLRLSMARDEGRL